MSTVDVPTLKARAEELIAKAIAGEGTVIEQNGKRAVLLPCEGAAPDFELDRAMDGLLRARAKAPGSEPTAADWQGFTGGRFEEMKVIVKSRFGMTCAKLVC
jgi:hypothetical protein